MNHDKPLVDGRPRCALCQREAPLQFHHLIPRKNHRKPWFRRNFTRDEMQQRGALLCRLCHGFIHRQFDEQALGRTLNTVEALLAEPAVQKHITWARRQRTAAPKR
ncbi:hypothetical protein GYB61_10240 [bacterium]|nr:hypothetical protein [bacterium]